VYLFIDFTNNNANVKHNILRLLFYGLYYLLSSATVSARFSSLLFLLSRATACTCTCSVFAFNELNDDGDIATKIARYCCAFQEQADGRCDIQHSATSSPASHSSQSDRIQIMTSWTKTNDTSPTASSTDDRRCSLSSSSSSSDGKITVVDITHMYLLINYAKPHGEFFKDNVTGGDIRLKWHGRVVTRGTPWCRLPARQEF